MSYYIVIPAPVRHCKKIPEGAKLLFGDIAGLAKKEGHCYASDEHFAVVAGKTTRQIHTYIQRLAEMGHISIEGRGKDRRIYIGKMNLSSPPLEGNCKSHLIYNTNTYTKEEVSRYFQQVKNLSVVVSDEQADLFDVYWQDKGGIDGAWKRFANRWYLNGTRFGNIVAPGPGKDFEEVADISTGMVSRRWEKRANGLYYRRGQR